MALWGYVLQIGFCTRLFSFDPSAVSTYKQENVVFIAWIDTASAWRLQRLAQLRIFESHRQLSRNCDRLYRHLHPQLSRPTEIPFYYVLGSRSAYSQKVLGLKKSFSTIMHLFASHSRTKPGASPLLLPNNTKNRHLWTLEQDPGLLPTTSPSITECSMLKPS